MNNLKLPPSIISKLKNKAPTYDISEDYGRRLGFYGDSDECGVGYEAVCIYVQNGLAVHLDLFKEIAKGIIKIQSDNMRYYPLLIFGFGNTMQLQYEKKHFMMGMLNDFSLYNKIAEAISRLSGATLYNPSVIPVLFPKTDMRSLYEGKTKISRNDLLVIIGRKNEVFFNEVLKEKITNSLKKQMLFIEIEDDSVSYNINKIALDYKP